MTCLLNPERTSTFHPRQKPHRGGDRGPKVTTSMVEALRLPVPETPAPAPIRVPVAAQPTPALTAEDVFRDYSARVYSAAWRMLGNHADAEDICQEVLLQVVRRLSTFRGESLLSTWLYRVTVNAVLALRRKRAVRRECRLSDATDDGLGEGRPMLPKTATPPEQALHRELQDLISGAIAQLPPMYRGTYVLADVQGLANAEVGSILGLSVAAVKSRLHRARRLMRQALATHFAEEHG
jgi:RNA polymerase sigma-70 factor (ECF subfamily)